MDLDQKIVELKNQKTPFCIITIVKVSGSAPRHVGSKMIVLSGGQIYGTIGGGALEHQIIADAKESLRRKIAELKSYPLGPMLGQCCGGEVDVFIEPVLAKKEMIVFGAGHIAEELCPMLSKINFHVTLIDERKERIELSSFEKVDTRSNELPSDALKNIKFHDDLYLIVITHQHKHDEEILEYCFGKPFRYLGCIGSKTKWEKFKARYRARGITDNELARVSTPIGLDIGSETPFEIAVSIVAQLITLNANKS